MKIIKVRGIDLEVHSDGRVFSVPFGTSLRNMGRRERKQSSRLGYKVIGLFGADKRSVPYPVHRLVAQAFLSDWDEGLVVDHIDCDKGNNNVENLRMLTNTENLRIYYREQRVSSGVLRKGENKYGYKNVGMDKRRGTYTALIRIGHSRVYGGDYRSPIEAAIAINNICVERGLGFHRFNIPLLAEQPNRFTLNRVFARY